jgi:glycerate kinase
MKRIIIAAGAFKHSLSVLEALETIRQGLDDSGFVYDIVDMPLADGGNGTLDAFLYHGGQRIQVDVHDPLGRKINSEYGLIDDGQTAVIEMALASGLELLTDEERAPLQATTYGTGELLKSALDHPVKRVIVGLGGSATNDGGCGALSALGVTFFDDNDQILVPRPDNLTAIRRIDVQDVKQRWHDVEVVLAVDVDNPVLGERGASAVFAPQKGASQADIQQLETGLDHYFGLLAEQVGKDVRDLAGAGAAGALAGGLMAVLDAKIMSGVELLMQTVRFEEIIQQADYIITSEGKIDQQTLGGKIILGVAETAKRYGVPCLAFVGNLSIDEQILREKGLSVVIPIIDRPMTLDDALVDAKKLLKQSVRRVSWLINL